MKLFPVMDFSQEYHIHFGTVFILWFLNTISVLNTTLFCGRIIYPHFYICRRFRLFSYGFAAQKKEYCTRNIPIFLFLWFQLNHRKTLLRLSAIRPDFECELSPFSVVYGFKPFTEKHPHFLVYSAMV